MKRLGMIILASVWLVAAGFASGAGQLYSKAIKFAKDGKKDFAYMHFNKLLRNFPTSKYRQEALFATGEYYFQTSEWNKAQLTFQTFLNDFPDSQDRLYALVHLYHLAQKDHNQPIIDELAKKIIDLHSVSLVFRNSKEFAFRSPLAQHYKTVIHIDKIEFFLEGDLFAKVAF